MNDNPVLDNVLQTTSSISPLGVTTARDAIDQPGEVRSGLGIASLVISLLGLVAGVGTKIWQTKKQNEYNQEMLDKQNAYNSPVEQMARLKAAGLNPMVMASQGGVSAGSSELGKKEAPDISSVVNTQQLLSALSLSSQMAVNEAQVRNLDASADLKTAQGLTEIAKQDYYTSNARKADAWRNYYLPAQTRFLGLKADYTAKELEYADDWILSRVDLNRASEEQKRALIDRYSHLNDLSDQQIKESIARIALFQEQGKYFSANAAYLDKRTDLVDMDYVLKFWDSMIKQEMLKLTGEKADTWIPEKVADITEKALKAGKSAVEILKMLMMMGVL